MKNLHWPVTFDKLRKRKNIIWFRRGCQMLKILASAGSATPCTLASGGGIRPAIGLIMYGYIMRAENPFPLTTPTVNHVIVDVFMAPYNRWAVQNFVFGMYGDMLVLASYPRINLRVRHGP